MIRITPRQFSSQRPFVEEMAALRVEPRVIQHRSLRFRAGGWPPGPRDVVWTVEASIEWAGVPMSLSIDVLPSRQRLGGQRWWWSCGRCGRRCGVLLSPEQGQPFACRRCWGAVYTSDYPRRQEFRSIRQMFGTESGGPLDRFEQLEHLTARRRRGVRRGRRVRLRAVRLMGRLLREGAS